MITMTIDEDLLEDLDTASEYLDRARDLLASVGQTDLADEIQHVLERLEERIINMEEELGLAE